MFNCRYIQLHILFIIISLANCVCIIEYIYAPSYVYTRTCVYTYEGGEEGIFSANRFNWDELILNNKA